MGGLNLGGGGACSKQRAMFSHEGFLFWHYIGIYALRVDSRWTSDGVVEGSSRVSDGRSELEGDKMNSGSLGSATTLFGITDVESCTWINLCRNGSG